MKAKGWTISLAVIAIIVVAAVLAMKSRKSEEPGKYDDFAKCLTEKGVVMYGAYWCPHCKNQEELFGNSWELVNYVECSLPNRAGQTQVCSSAGIKGYPTWEFSDGSRAEGELSMRQLSEKGNCSLSG